MRDLALEGVGIGGFVGEGGTGGKEEEDEVTLWLVYKLNRKYLNNNIKMQKKKKFTVRHAKDKGGKEIRRKES